MQQLYELNVRTWRTERSFELGRPATLDDLPESMLDQLVEHGFTWIYLIGVWPTGPLAREVSLRDQHLRTYLSGVLPDFRDEDVCGSPFMPEGYAVDAALGGDAALARLRERARGAGISLMLDFIPNHVGLDHPWLRDHPDYFIQGDDGRLAAQPDAWCKLHNRVFAHGRDPFFAPWKNSVQLDYSNPRLQEAMIQEASSIAARCDGLRCDLAMLLLKDVFENTWKRPMPPFWRKCLDRVRAEHPGTLFMAEVYWNREYELQQAGFDFTFDKILYDRLLSGDAESIRGHLRATRDYQKHCVRFLENHAEQRAAARFTSAEHHRGALLLTGMVPGLLLCNHGQDDGRRLHASNHANRRPAEEGSQPHREAYRDLMHLLSEPARQNGAWQLLEPLGHDSPLVGCLWTLQGHHALVLVVNAGWQHTQGAVQAGPLVERDCQLQQCFANAQPLQLKAEALRGGGLPVSLPPWGSIAYRVMPLR
jgi:Alpha amylase, catalytic domain